MDQTQIIGYAVTVVITLGSFIAVIQKFTQPINELKIVIQKLNDNIDTLKIDNDTQNRRLDRHRAEIEALQKDVNELKLKMNMFHRNEHINQI